MYTSIHNPVGILEDVAFEFSFPFGIVAVDVLQWTEALPSVCPKVSLLQESLAGLCSGAETLGRLDLPISFESKENCTAQRFPFGWRNPEVQQGKVQEAAWERGDNNTPNNGVVPRLWSSV